MLVHGSLSKQGSLCQNFFVDGRLTVTNLLVADDGSLFIKGRTKVENVALFYRDFSTEYRLKLEAKVFIADNHIHFKSTSICTPETTIIDVRELEIRDRADYYNDRIEEVFDLDVVSYAYEKPYFDRYKALKELVHNPYFEVLKKNIKSYNVMLDEELDEFIKNSVTELDLSDKYIFEFPHKLFKLKNLKKLNLSNTLIKNIPEKIIGLTALEELNLSHCRIESLPKLPDLKVLDISHNHFREFPEHVFKIKTLETLFLQMNSTCTTVNSFGDLHALKYLNINTLGDNLFPKGLSSAKNLETLILGADVKIFKSLIDLSVFPKLRVLKFDGFFYVRYRDIEQLLKMNLENLEELDIQALFKSHDLEDSEAFYKGSSVSDFSLPLTLPREIGNLHALRKLNIRYSQLETLPKSFFQLKNLEMFEFEGNEFNLETAIKINKYFKFETLNKFSNVSRLGNVAWNKYKRAGDDETKLKKALLFTDKALEMANTLNSRHPCTSPIIDTQVRIYLKLKNHNKAYSISKEALDFNPHDENLEDIRDSEGYKQWLLDHSIKIKDNK